VVNEKLSPEIRFDGYYDEWIVDTLGELTDVFDGTHQTPVYTDSGIMFLSVENIKTLTSNKFISVEAFHNDFKVYPQKGDVLMTRIGDIGTANIVETDMPVAYYVSLALLKKKALNPHFLKTVIHTEAVWRELWHRTLHIAFPKKINMNEIKKVLVNYPADTDEQVELGNFFRSLDDTIVLKKQQYEQTDNIKKSMLEKMFPKKGADVPEIRFDGFTGAWQEKKIVDVCSISTGKSNTQDRTDEGTYPFYVRSSIIERSKRFLFDEEAVLTVGDGVGTGKVFHYVNGKYDLHQRVYRMFDFNSEVIGKYFYYYFSKHFYERVMSMTAKTSVDSVRLDMISDMDFVHPSKGEQEMIVNFLDNLDTLIIAQQNELEKLQNIKKACLSKMFV